MADLARIKQLATENKLDELRQIAMTQGLTPHHAMKAQTVAKMILDKIANPVKQSETLKHPAEQPIKKDAVPHTEDEVRKACAPYITKEGFEAKFLDDQTWHFKFKGAEDSGHMTVPLRAIRMKAEMVAQGRRVPMGVNADFGRLPGADGPNAYTNTVLNA